MNGKNKHARDDFLPPPPSPKKKNGGEQVINMDMNDDGIVDADEILKTLDTNNDNIIDDDELERLKTFQVPKRLETRENGYGINHVLYTFYRFINALHKPLYVVFFVLTYFVQSDFYVTEQYYLNEIFIDRFIDSTFTDTDGFQSTFRDITDVDNIWRYIDRVFLPNVSPVQITDPIQNAYSDTVKDDGTRPLTIDGLLEIVGPPSLRQVRAASPYLGADVPMQTGKEWLLSDTHNNATCDAFTALVSNNEVPCTVCNTFMFTGAESRKKLQLSCGCEALRAAHSKIVDTSDVVWSGHQSAYNGKGFVLLLPINEADVTVETTFEGQLRQRILYQATCSKERLGFLKNNRWIDQSTRSVHITFCVKPFTTDVKNMRDGAIQDTDVGGCFRILFEISRYQYVIPHYEILTLRTSVSGEVGAETRGRVQMVLVGFATFLLLTELLELLVHRMNYFWGENIIWNGLDLFTGSLCLVIAANYSPAPLQEAADEGKLNAIDLNETYVSIIYVANRFAQFYGTLLFIISLRLTKVMAVAPTFKLPILTLFAAIFESMPFLLFLLIWGVSGAHFFMMFYGSQLLHFHSFWASGKSTLRIFIGDLDYDQFEGTQMKYSAASIMTLYAIVTLYILFTMFVSIIDGAYTRISDVLENERKEKAEYVKVNMKDLRRPYLGDKIYKKIKSILNIVADKLGKGQMAIVRTSNVGNKKIVPES